MVCRRLRFGAPYLKSLGVFTLLFSYAFSLSLSLLISSFHALSIPENIFLAARMETPSQVTQIRNCSVQSLEYKVKFSR
jgi:hypothetical protein